MSLSTATQEAGVVTTAPATRPAAPRKRRTDRKEWLWAALFVAPLLFGVLVFYIWPIIRNAYFSFTTWGVFGGATWSGLANYQAMLADPSFWRSIVNTLIYIGFLLIGIPLAVIFASLINRPGLRFAALYRTAFFLPYVAMPAAVSMVWRIIFNGDFGVINYALSLVGIKGPNWLSTEWVALIAVGLVGMWISLGFNLIVLSAGMKGIPPEMYEASSLDGASRLRQFFSITVPLLSPSIFFVSVMTVITGFQLFDLLYALMGTQNPALNQTQSMVYLFFAHQQTGDNGYAAAVGMAILVLVGVFTIIQFRMQKRWVTYV
ncbi:sugar ABC transporter permease [Leifsonia sp. PS1209]|uniref:carbohydrate ABC transporter permease n=1 Tax=Leifsonia sp. PS1209 TaxID=2724914 RepID=UPI001442B6EF|nr:sugar ABC transporter permease [Leifsonia sp. PS1209]QIZ98432.1 sugar ABC transporter permease [Leifsonia sp. PS1209]